MESCEKKQPLSTLMEKDGNIDDDSQVDRLSSLPDSLLITILSLLSVDEAAATSVLSRHWRYLWTHITDLVVDFPEEEDYEIYVPTVDYILSRIKSPKIHTFDLAFSHLLSVYLCESTEFNNFRFILPWIRQICRRNPEIIDVSLDCSPYSRRNFVMPACLLRTQSLVKLTLSLRCKFKLPKDGLPYINLPNLRELDMCIGDRNCRVMDTLFKSCPLLERLELSLFLYKNDKLIDITATNLKHLQLDIQENSCRVDCNFVIDAPKLEHCQLTGAAFYHFVKNPTNLQIVTIGYDDFCKERHHDDKMIEGLIRGTSSVRDLSLFNYTGGIIFKYLCGISLPVFHNLIHLRFYLNYKVGHVPRCLLGNLKTLRIVLRKCNGFEIKILRQILSDAAVLEKLRLSVDYAYSVRTIMEYKLQLESKFCKDLFRLPKSSPSCQIQFFGKKITASKEFT